MRLLSLICFSIHGLCLSASADGNVTGIVVLDSQRPPDVPAGYRPLTVKPIQAEDQAPAIVWVERKGMAYPKLGTSKVLSIPQRGYQFRPAVLAVQTGTRVTFPNMDDEFHHVCTYSKPYLFDLGQYTKEQKPEPLVFDKPGLVKIYCEIHKHMRCRLLVLETPWFAMTDTSGGFKITGIPSGEYEIKAMLPSEKQVKSTVVISDGKTTQVKLSR